MKVWLITHGAYSDYCVLCAFTTRELAIAYAAKMNGVTTDEQRQLQDIVDANLKWPQHKAALEQLPAHVRRIDNDDRHIVEDRDLYDELPIATL